MSSVQRTLPAGTPACASLAGLLRQEILTGQIPRGKRLTIAELVKRHGFSQMPVRWALRLYDHYDSIAGSLRRAYGYSTQRRMEMAQDHKDTPESLETQDDDRIIRPIVSQSNRGMDDLIAKLGQ